MEVVKVPRGFEIPELNMKIVKTTRGYKIEGGTASENYLRIGDFQICWGKKSYVAGDWGWNPKYFNLPVSFLDVSYIVDGSMTLFDYPLDRNMCAKKFEVIEKDKARFIYNHQNISGQDTRGWIYGINWIAIGKWE